HPAGALDRAGIYDCAGVSEEPDPGGAEQGAARREYHTGIRDRANLRLDGRIAERHDRSVIIQRVAGREQRNTEAVVAGPTLDRAEVDEIGGGRGGAGVIIADFDSVIAA